MAWENVSGCELSAHTPSMTSNDTWEYSSDILSSVSRTRCFVCLRLARC
jgi:hypothetical protein